MRFLVVAAAIAATLGAACSSSSKPHDDGAIAAQRETPPAPGAPAPKVVIAAPSGDVAVEVEIVATPAKIEKGLMFRQNLPPDAGMLFFMNEERVWPFWMRNTLIPLDMIFIAKNLTIAGIVENAEPRTETLRQVDAPSFYVLEVNGGWAAAHKVAAGAKVRFENMVSR